VNAQAGQHRHGRLVAGQCGRPPARGYRAESRHVAVIKLPAAIATVVARLPHPPESAAAHPVDNLLGPTGPIVATNGPWTISATVHPLVR
jgi:hypothetical protein